MSMILVKMLNFFLGCVVNLLVTGAGLVVGFCFGLLINAIVSPILMKSSLRWCHARVERNDDRNLTKNGLRDFTYKGAHIREMQCLIIYVVILLLMLGLFLYLTFGGVLQARYYWGAVDGVHVLFSPLSLYFGTFLMSALILMSGIYAHGDYYFDVTQLKSGEEVLTLGDRGYRYGITLDEKGKFVSV